MEKLLRSKEMDKINKLFNDAFDLRSNLVFFPVRHHSPVCSYHLRNTIEEYLPEIILIEGPIDGNNIKDSLAHEDSNPPFAIYYSYSDSKGLIDDTRGKYRCYYPFLDYSPELIGIREGKKKNIETRFIDLSYADILINSKKGKGLLKKEDKLSYNDDYFLEENKFIEELCKREGCRSFNEFWEKLFEIQGLYMSKEDFVKNMFSYCYLSRMCSTKEELISEGCSAESISKLLVLSFNMGLDEIFNSTINSLKNVIAEDGSIYSLINCLYYLNYIYTMRELYFMNSMNEVKNIIFYVYSKVCILIPDMASINEEEALKGVNSLKEVFNIVVKRELDLDDTLLKEALFSLLRFDSVNAGIEGAASGILYGLNELKAEGAAKSVEGYIFGTKEKALKAPSFLNGLFSTARDLVFVEGSILKSIDKYAAKKMEQSGIV
ncbi:DUF5682 family protein [Clostridium ljungdahlii]|uniref:Uncharacterized protein n=1 Tax=Clostridium ljungdahlii TaxID=1538 RepID=A0A162J0J4_9CLOT|nr:DUF5682 family protein [Clostridium ljungdahlii]OAA86025.1 hypothetical protein WY13_02485 [Clostridium ljungdahlii]